MITINKSKPLDIISDNNLISKGFYKAYVYIVGDYSYETIDVIKIAESIKVGNLKLDYKVVNSGRIRGVESGLGNIQAGRQYSINVPILYKSQTLDTIGILDQINTINSKLIHSHLNKYYLVYEIKDELYQAEISFTDVSGYTIQDILNAKSITLNFSQIDNYFYKTEDTEIILNINEIELDENNQQDIEVEVDTYTPTLADFEFNFNVTQTDKPFYFYFANKVNYGITLTQDLTLGEHTLIFKNKVLLIDDVAYAYDGIQFELNRGKNILYYECNAPFISGKITYKKGMII